MTLIVQVETLTYMVIFVFHVEVHSINMFNIYYFFTKKINILGMFQTCCFTSPCFFSIKAQFNSKYNILDNIIQQSI